MISNFSFVALDLETTGLSHDTDTIIEVAAMRFHLEREGDIFHMIDIEERTMLIDPGREISDQISMITGISDAMVRGKPKWSEVQERVRDFIGENTIILGHNVLFDIGMLKAHGIDISSHITLDTFELSELFSSDAESLNLGFLGKKYGLDDGSEHRALDDTRLSARLFVHYLSDIVYMSDQEGSLWRYARGRDTSESITTLLDIVGDSISSDTYTSDKLDISVGVEHISGGPEREIVPKIYALGPDWKYERSIIEGGVKRGKVLLFTSSSRQSLWLEGNLGEYRVAHHIDHESIVSVEMVRAFLHQKKWSRKETILIMKIAKWIEVTETGNLDEIKWYGDEMGYKDILRSDRDETTRYHERARVLEDSADIIFAEYGSRESRYAISRDHSTLIVRDIVELDQALRYRDSHTVSWRDLYRYIDICMSDDKILRERLITAISLIEEIVRDVITRPTGPSLSPPGEYGETYFYTQEDLWYRGHIWIIYARDQIREILGSGEISFTDTEVIEEGYYHLFRKLIDPILDLIEYRDSDIGLILRIKHDETLLSLIPRSMKSVISGFLRIHGADDTILIGQGLISSPISDFLMRECGISGIGELSVGGYPVEYRDSLVVGVGRTVILGTNLKNLRAIASDMKKKYKDRPIYTQGISGGKGKMRSLFLREDNSILIGLIDTWKDDSTLWEGAESIYITKVPFDPPSDPYYLARTVGMANNFENYSLPLAIHTIVTLISRITYAEPDAQIYITDEKIMTMAWGRDFRNILKI